ncbi:hypothetical protein GCK32_014084 [Trichostrongylus colubriformis]|uniref:Saccharopine dehydrogenase NADP binding domain-containing protein n=1 Tax=Trichostrongylus colubriformis TaxID=6319 RepID=A0AAN8G2T4_TRICO
MSREGKDLKSTPIIIADSSDETSLAEMAKQAKVILNAVGPYRLYGEVVVKAAVENGASHVDISGEPAFLEKMQMLYGEKAKEKGVYVVGACGWDSIPCDMGVNFVKEHFDGDVNHVETFVQMNSGSFGLFKRAGPTKEQMEEASFTYWFFAYGYSDRKPLEEQHNGKPDQKMVVTCKGPDAGYMATKVVSSQRHQHLPKLSSIHTLNHSVSHFKWKLRRDISRWCS